MKIILTMIINVIIIEKKIKKTIKKINMMIIIIKKIKIKKMNKTALKNLNHHIILINIIKDMIIENTI